MMNQSQSLPSVSGEIMIFWAFGRPAETIAAVVKYPNGKPFLLVASPEARLTDPTFDEELLRDTLRTYLSEMELNALWIEYELPDGVQEGEELVTCPNCHQGFTLKPSAYEPFQLDFADLSIPNQLLFLYQCFGHDC